MQWETHTERNQANETLFFAAGGVDEASVEEDCFNPFRRLFLAFFDSDRCAASNAFVSFCIIRFSRTERDGLKE
jgi:hypothetical protein